MRKSVLIAAATISLLSACGEQAVENEAESAATNNATATPAAPRSPLRQPPPRPRRRRSRSCTIAMRAWRQIGKATKAIGTQLKAENPEPRRPSGRTPRPINDLAAKSENWFPAGTGPDVGKTRAKAEIWQKPDDFAAKDRDFRVAAQALQAAADSGGRERDQAAHSRDLGKSVQGVPRPVPRRREALTEDAAEAAPPPRKIAIWDLPTRLFHWMLVAPDRLQLVDGGGASRRSPPLFGLRGPEPAALPHPVGRRRKLDGALRQFRRRSEGSVRLSAGQLARDRPQSTWRAQRRRFARSRCPAGRARA